MGRVRSILFMAWLLTISTVMMLGFIPLTLLPRPVIMVPYRWWQKLALWGFRVIIGVRVVIRGLDKVPREPVLVASKHQSMWDTIILSLLFKDPTLVLKRELMRIPVYGWYIKVFGLIPIDRDAGPSALRTMLRTAKAAWNEGRTIVIFPEGSRMPPGETQPYKPGVAALYSGLKAVCVPVAHNSGLCWPAEGIDFRPGTITLEVLDPIPAGLPREDMMHALEARIETASRRLLGDALQDRSLEGAPGNTP